MRLPFTFQEKHEAVRRENQLLRGDIQVLEKRLELARAAAADQRLESRSTSQELVDAVANVANGLVAGDMPTPV